MKAVLRNIGALFLGLALGVVIIFAAQAINMKVHPVPADFDPANRAMVTAYVESLPSSLLAIVLAEYLVGFTAAVFLATRLSASAHFRQGILVSAFFAASSFMNLNALPHPWWFWVGNIAVLFFAFWYGVRWGMPKPTATE